MDLVTEDDVEAGEANTDAGEDVIAAAASVYHELTGRYPDGPMVNLPELGPSWDFDDEQEMRTRYPRATALFFATE